MTTVDTPTLFDAPTLDAAAAQQGRAEGIAQADENAVGEWKAKADDLIARLAREQPDIVSDDVWDAGLGGNPAGSNTALGARFVAAARAGLIRKTDRVRPTAQAASHGSPMTVWLSLTYEAPPSLFEAES